MDWPQVCLSENSELNFDDLEFDLEYSVMLILAMNLYFSITLLFPEYPGNSVWHLLQSPHPLLNPKHPPMILHSNWTLQPWNILFFWEPMNQTWTTQSTALSFSSTVLHCCFCGSSDNLCTVANNKGKKSSQPDFQCLYNMQSRRFDKSLKESKRRKNRIYSGFWNAKLAQSGVGISIWWTITVNLNITVLPINYMYFITAQATSPRHRNESIRFCCFQGNYNRIRESRTFQGSVEKIIRQS